MSTYYNYTAANSSINNNNTQSNSGYAVRSGSYITPRQDEAMNKYLNSQPAYDPIYQRSTLPVNQNIDSRQQFLYSSDKPAASYTSYTYSNIPSTQPTTTTTTPYAVTNTYTPYSGLYSTQPVYIAPQAGTTTTTTMNTSNAYTNKEPGENLFQYSKLANVQVKDVYTPVKNYDDSDQVKRAGRKNEAPVVGTYTTSQYLTTPAYQPTTNTTTTAGGYNYIDYKPQSSSSTMTKSQLVFGEDAGQAVLLRSSHLAQVNAVQPHELKSVQEQNITMCNIF